MGIQEIFVLGFVLLAVVYVGRLFVRKAGSFKPSTNCANDCGCSDPSSDKKITA